MPSLLFFPALLGVWFTKNLYSEKDKTLGN